jgi:hypothetical protein
VAYTGEVQVGVNEYTLIANGSLDSYRTGGPLVSPLGDYGGGTLTHALPREISAVDAITPEDLTVEEDQRGMCRGTGAPDRGIHGDIGALK